MTWTDDDVRDAVAEAYREGVSTGRELGFPSLGDRSEDGLWERSLACHTLEERIRLPSYEAVARLVAEGRPFDQLQMLFRCHFPAEQTMLVAPGAVTTRDLKERPRRFICQGTMESVTGGRWG